jgi:3-methylcrotonyl-CoA carboxylase alpha subunit
LNLPHETVVRLWWGDAGHAIGLRAGEAGRWRIAGLPGIGEVAAQRLGRHDLSIDLAGRLITATVVPHDDTVDVRLAGQSWLLATRQPVKDEGGAGDARLVAPMPGRVLAVDVAPGQQVATGDRLLVLEAMKMEHRLIARSAGTVAAVHVSVGDQVADGMCLVEFG